MGLPILGDLIREVGATLRQVIPNPQTRAEFELRLAELADRADAREDALVQGQIEVNREEARHANLFVAGGRPFIIWVCGTGLAIEFVVRPFAVAFGVARFPHIDHDLLLALLAPILGLGAMRTFEKTRGVATSLGGEVLRPVLPTAPTAPLPAASGETGAKAPARKLPDWFPRHG